MNWLYTVIFFVVTIGATLFSDYKPFKSKNMNIAFTVVLILASLIVWVYVLPKIHEGFNPDTRIDQPCPEGSVKHRNGDCRMKGEGEAP